MSKASDLPPSFTAEMPIEDLIPQIQSVRALSREAYSFELASKASDLLISGMLVKGGETLTSHGIYSLEDISGEFLYSFGRSSVSAHLNRHIAQQARGRAVSAKADLDERVLVDLTDKRVKAEAIVPETLPIEKFTRIPTNSYKSPVERLDKVEGRVWIVKVNEGELFLRPAARATGKQGRVQGNYVVRLLDSENEPLVRLSLLE